MLLPKLSPVATEVARPRHRTRLSRFDWSGLLLLGIATTALLLALSGFSGLPLPLWTSALLVAVSGMAFIGFMIRERRSPSPLVTMSVLRPMAVSVGLIGALCAYLVLFGPLTLFPQVLGTHGVTTGLILTSLPAGFAVAAVSAERLLPNRWDARTRGLIGALTCVVATGILVVAPAAPVWVAASLLLLGRGWGCSFRSTTAPSWPRSRPGCPPAEAAW
ncbi:MAG: hypothetical protein ACRDRG_09095 [Pseudonocardiaceae bacterium]